MKSLWAIILAFVITTSSAFAATGTPNELFRPISTVHVQKVIDKGYTKIKQLDLKKLLSELEEVEWRTFAYGFLSGSGGKRFTSVYFVEDKMVVINMMSLQNLVGKPVPLYSWALHEAMGALGYNDENYELSSSISFIANSDLEQAPKNFEAVKTNFKSVPRTAKNQSYSGDGGSTVIGGGGDASMIELKQKLLMRLKTWVLRNNMNVSEDEVAHALARLTLLKMEINIQEHNLNSMQFNIEGDKIAFDQGVEFRLELLYQDEYLDSILTGLQDYLFN